MQQLSWWLIFFFRCVCIMLGCCVNFWRQLALEAILRKEESSRRSVLEKRRKDTRDECLVGDVVGKLESVSYGVGPHDQFDPCNFRSATSEF
jgi:hypothetical protein